MPHQWIRGSLKTDGSVPEELPGRLYLPGWVRLVMGSYAQGEIAFGAPNPCLLPVRLQLRRQRSRYNKAHCWCGNNRLTFLGYYGDFFTGICASEDSRSLMGGTVVNCVRLVIDCHNRWQGSWVHSVGWDCCTILSPVH